MAFFIWWSFPIEYQLYPTGSNGIDWHVDTAPFAPNAIEGVLTLCKSSNSTFSYLKHCIFHGEKLAFLLDFGNVFHIFLIFRREFCLEGPTYPYFFDFKKDMYNFTVFSTARD